MAINRTAFNATIEPSKAAGVAKVIASSTTINGYAHIVTVRTSFQDGKPVEQYTDILIHPDRAADLDVQQFDAVMVNAPSQRQVLGEAKPNTQYIWAKGVKAVGRHTVNIEQVDGKRVVTPTGVQLYDLSVKQDEPEEKELDPTDMTAEQIAAALQEA